jgi:predicted ABC-type ATPase
VKPPEALILAGPNGAGKTTSSASLVPPGTRFLNSDVLTAQLLEEGHSPAGVDVAAGRLILEQLRAALVSGEPFCIETNLAGRAYVRWIEDWRRRGYLVRLAFFALDSPELALHRVATRVSLGGHDVPEAVVRRRWVAGLRGLFDLYLPVVDYWTIFDSSDGTVRQVAQGDRQGSLRRIMDQDRWAQLLTLADLAGALAVRPGGEFFDPVAPIHNDGNSES